MAAEEREDSTIEEHSFDELAKGLVSNALSREKALKLLGATLLGGLLGSGVFGLPAAEAKRRHRRRRRLPVSPPPPPPPPPPCIGGSIAGCGSCCNDKAPACFCVLNKEDALACLPQGEFCSDIPCATNNDCPNGRPCVAIGGGMSQCGCNATSQCPANTTCAISNLCVPFCGYTCPT